MTKDEIKAFLQDKPGYLKEGATRLSEKLDCSVETCRHALKEARLDAKGSDFDLDNISSSEISEFKQFLKDNEIEETDVKSVKFWQNMQGDHRFSVVVKGEDDLMAKAKIEIVELLESYSPKVEADYKQVQDAVVYEISLPDIHYGKYTGQTLDEAEEEYMNAIKELLVKAVSDDELLKILSEHKGMLGLSLYPHHLKDGTDCSLESFCEMTAKTAEIMGVEKIGIGSDLCLNQPDTIVEWMRNGTWTKSKNYGEGSKNKHGFPKQPDWFLDARGFKNLESGLKKVGFSESEVNGILGNNWYNFYKEMNQ